MWREIAAVAAVATVILGIGWLSTGDEDDEQQESSRKKKERHEDKEVDKDAPPEPPEGFVWVHQEALSFVVPADWQRDTGVVYQQNANVRKGKLCDSESVQSIIL